MGIWTFGVVFILYFPTHNLLQFYCEKIVWNICIIKALDSYFKLMFNVKNEEITIFIVLHFMT